MINLKLSPPVVDLMQFSGVTQGDAEKTLNNRHRGLVDEALTRIIAAHWIADDQIVFLDGPVTDKIINQADGKVQFKEVTASLVILLRPQLPNGKISREMRMTDILENVANSFGHPVTASLDRPYSKLYSGQWNGNEISFFEPVPNATFALCGSFNPDAKYANMLWAFNSDAYRDWFLETHTEAT